MTPKQIVLAKYPTAVCESNGDLGYVIYQVGSYGKTIRELGHHFYYRRSAWANAAEKLRRKAKE